MSWTCDAWLKVTVVKMRAEARPEKTTLACHRPLVVGSAYDEIDGMDGPGTLRRGLGCPSAAAFTELGSRRDLLRGLRSLVLRQRRRRRRRSEGTDGEARLHQ